VTTGDESAEPEAWRIVDEGWGRRAVDFATLSEPANCREYVTLHQRLGVGPDDRLLDIACGADLAVELAEARGARCAGIDASARLVAVARDRNPSADIRVGDMHALPWDDASFDVASSFRGIWGTTPGAVAEVRRVLAPGGRLGITVWCHIKRSPGAWALAPFTMASPPKVANQAAMVALGRPGVGEELLVDAGFVDIQRTEIAPSYGSSPTPPPMHARSRRPDPPSRPSRPSARKPSWRRRSPPPSTASATGCRFVLPSPSSATRLGSRRPPGAPVASTRRRRRVPASSRSWRRRPRCNVSTTRTSKRAGT
jgi:SAM-dependent methyltransferase